MVDVVLSHINALKIVSARYIDYLIVRIPQEKILPLKGSFSMNIL